MNILLRAIATIAILGVLSLVLAIPASLNRKSNASFYLMIAGVGAIPLMAILGLISIWWNR